MDTWHSEWYQDVPAKTGKEYKPCKVDCVRNHRPGK